MLSLLLQWPRESQNEEKIDLRSLKTGTVCKLIDTSACGANDPSKLHINKKSIEFNYFSIIISREHVIFHIFFRSEV